MPACLSQGRRNARIWPLQRYLDRIDTQLGTPILKKLAARHAFSGSGTQIEQLLSRLGVIRTQLGVKLDDAAELSHLRRSIICGRSCSKH